MEVVREGVRVCCVFAERSFGGVFVGQELRSLSGQWWEGDGELQNEAYLARSFFSRAVCGEILGVQ